MDDGDRLSDEELALIREAFASIDLAAIFGFRAADAPSDRHETLLDLARAGDETTFKDLARAFGVAAADVDRLWMGTVARARST